MEKNDPTPVSDLKLYILAVLPLTYTKPSFLGFFFFLGITYSCKLDLIDVQCTAKISALG